MSALQNKYNSATQVIWGEQYKSTPYRSSIWTQTVERLIRQYETIIPCLLEGLFGFSSSLVVAVVFRFAHLQGKPPGLVKVLVPFAYFQQGT